MAERRDLPVTVQHMVELKKLMPKPLIVGSNRYGRIRLRALTGGDVDFLERLHAQHLAAREFCVSLVQHQLARPELEIEAVRSWPDRLLLRVASAWSVSELGLRQNDAQEPAPSFESVVVAYQERLAGYKKDVRAMSSAAAWLASGNIPTLALTKAFAMTESLRSSCAYSMTQVLDKSKVAALMKVSTDVSRQIGAITGAIDKQAAILDKVATVTTAIHKQAAILDKVATLCKASDRLFSNLPDFSRLTAAWEKAEQGRDSLIDAGYGFAVHLFPFISLAKVTRHDARTKDAGITNEFCAMTRDPEFRPMVGDLFSNSSILMPRWIIVEQGLIAHQERKYALSIPVFLAQLEGMFTDAMILKAVAVKKKGKIYAGDGGGKIKLDKLGRKIELIGLHKKVDHSPFRTDERLGMIAGAIVDHFAGPRNDILHGRNYRYARAKLSTQLMFVIYILAREMADFEAVKSKQSRNQPVLQGQQSSI